MLFADQLGPHFSDDVDDEILLVESRSVFRRRTVHRQKAHLLLSAIRHRAEELGDRARLVQASTYADALTQSGTPPADISVVDPTSYAARRWVRERGLTVLPARGFSLGEKEFQGWLGTRRPILEDFYRWQRSRLDILMEPDGAPVSGRWNFDADNRLPPPKGAATLGLVSPAYPVEDDIDAGVRRDLDRWAAEGDVAFLRVDGPRLFACTRDEALAALTDFVAHRLPAFGPYEDAVLRGDWAMAHSLLSVPLNLGLLDPLEVVDAAVAAYRRGVATLQCVEGLVRQVLGWR